MSIHHSVSTQENITQKTRLVIAKKKRLHNTQYLAALNTTLWHLEGVANAFQNTQNFQALSKEYFELHEKLIYLKGIYPAAIFGSKKEINESQEKVKNFIEKINLLNKA